MIQGVALLPFIPIEISAVESLTVNLAKSHVGGSKVILPLIEIPHGSRGIPKTCLSILPLLFSS